MKSIYFTGKIYITEKKGNYSIILPNVKENHFDKTYVTWKYFTIFLKDFVRTVKFVYSSESLP